MIKFISNGDNANVLDDNAICMLSFRKSQMLTIEFFLIANFIKYSTNYCISSLVQGGLEIPCRVVLSTPPTEREETSKVGSFQESKRTEP